MGIIAPEEVTDKGCKLRIDKGGGCYMPGVITPVGVSLRKNRMCRLHSGVILSRFFYDFLLLYL